jgi:N-6 DNA Methylase
LLLSPGISPAARSLYLEGYGFAHLRDRSVRRSAHDHHFDAWEGAKIVFLALERGEKILGLPALGGLFGGGLTPDLDDTKLPNRSFMAAIFKLSWLMDDDRRVRINWRDMATEELGSVYEGLLELVPVRKDHGRTFAFVGGEEAKGNARKISGSYYTPDTLVQALLDSALDPVLDRAEAEGGQDAILALNVIDPACGSGHFLLGAARRMATRVAQLRDNDAPDYPAAMRDVARNCIHGVDRNPMAVELAKVALWIETVEPGKPLGFLDANIQCGDSLLGIFDLKALEEGIPDDAYRPLTGDDKETAKGFAKRNRAERAGQGRFDWASGGSLPPAKLAIGMDDLRHLPEDTVEQVELKRKRFMAWTSDPKRWTTKVACDLYTAAFLLPKTAGVPADANSVTIPTTAHLRTRLGGGSLYGPLEIAAIDAAEYARVFHWPLAFPEVMIARGGFDVVLGNPPWERIKLQEEEFFALTAPDIAGAPNASERRKLIAALAREAEGSAGKKLYDQFELAKRIAEASSIFFAAPKDEDPTRGVTPSAARRYPWTGRGDINTYGLFAELFFSLRRDTGQAGVVLPLGIATSETLSPFFWYIVSNQNLRSLISLAEIKAWFAGTKDNQSFCLITFGKASTATFAFRLEEAADLQDKRRRFSLSPADIAKINPNTRTAPVFRAQADADLTTKIYSRVPVLIDQRKGAAGNPWGVSFMTMFHMSNDSGLFRTAAQLRSTGYVRELADWVKGDATRLVRERNILTNGRDAPQLDLPVSAIRNQERFLPLYEAKMIHHFDHRFGSYPDGHIEDTRALPRPTLAQQNDPKFEATPRSWVDEAEVSERLSDKGWKRRWLMGVRGITNVTNERTVIAAVWPYSAAGNSCHVWTFGPTFSPKLHACAYASLCSLTLDFVARQKIGGTNLNFFYVEQFPILRPSAYSESDLEFIVPKVLELSFTSYSMAPFARDLGYGGPPFEWNEDRRAGLRAELDAWYALAYGLSRDELRYVLDPKEIMGADYPSESFRVLKEREISRYGEYRTARLVMAAYDRLANEGMRPRTEGYL